MVELALTLTVLGILTAMSLPKVATILRRDRLNRTTATVAADLENAFSLAGRSRRPIRIACTCGSRTYTLADRNGGTVRLFRGLTSSDYGVTTLTFATRPARRTPSSTSFPRAWRPRRLTVTIAANGVSRTITLSTAGQVRIVP